MQTSLNTNIKSSKFCLRGARLNRVNKEFCFKCKRNRHVKRNRHWKKPFQWLNIKNTFLSDFTFLLIHWIGILSIHELTAETQIIISGSCHLVKMQSQLIFYLNLDVTMIKMVRIKKTKSKKYFINSMWNYKLFLTVYLLFNE